jgi:hypothetical protein
MFSRSLDVSKQKDFSKNLKELQPNTVSKVHGVIGRIRYKYIMTPPTRKHKKILHII